MEKAYQPEKYEEKIYKLWEKSGSFTPKKSKTKTPFCIIMPPPNANASLHVGHAMFIALEDIIIRFKRMQGHSTLWLPGHDHAGILTQVVFERELEKRGKSRFDLSREKFYKACWDFTEKNKKEMFKQLKRLGATCDWTREKFTLDKKISHEVLKTFVSLFKDGLVYRANRLVNWCPRCMTALSNLEVKYQEEKGRLWYLKYPLKEHSKITGQRRFLVVATTRPETMLGDTAVAVHPEDSRYREFVNKTVILPIQEREIPVIADKAVDPEFGTGVVKVTPGYDPIDFEIGLRHKLKAIQVIGFDNKMTKKAGDKFEDLGILEARRKVLKILAEQDLLLKSRAFCHRIGRCERCGTFIQPQISRQFFIKTQPLAKKAIRVVKKKQIKIIPKRFKKNYFQWMENIYDWCVSRQLWWGQRLPVWYCGVKGLSALQKAMNQELVKKFKKKKGCGQMIIALKKPARCPKCRRKNLIQDPDVFDTWFSSGQWPYTALGFTSRLKAKGKRKKEKLDDFNYWYPTSVMETGYEILFFWVARMIMLSLYRTGEIPFKIVYLHGLVLDETGEKMSKSRPEYSINPLDVCKSHGADALRMALVVGTGPGNDLTLTENKIKGYRNFANKIWNAARFVLTGKANKKTKKINADDQKILKKLKKIIKKTTKNLEEFKFSQAGETLYDFFWHDFCDNYLEVTKKRRAQAQPVLEEVLKTSLKLLHPFMPYVTESIWQEIKKKRESYLIEVKWPKA